MLIYLSISDVYKRQDEALFNAAQEITEQRKTQNAAWRNIPRQNCSGVLLGGNLYCAACGSRMTSSSPGEGAKRPYAEYICYMGANHRIACSGQKAYVAKRVDDLVLRDVYKRQPYVCFLHGWGLE